MNVQQKAENLTALIRAGNQDSHFTFTHSWPVPILLTSVHSSAQRLVRVLLGNTIVLDSKSWGNAPVIPPGHYIQIELLILSAEEHVAQVRLEWEENEEATKAEDRYQVARHEVARRVDANAPPHRLALELAKAAGAELVPPHGEPSTPFCGWCGAPAAKFLEAHGWRCDTCAKGGDPVERQADTAGQPWRMSPCPICGGRVRLLKKQDSVHDGRCTVCGWYTHRIFPEREP